MPPQPMRRDDGDDDDRVLYNFDDDDEEEEEADEGHAEVARHVDNLDDVDEAAAAMPPANVLLAVPGVNELMANEADDEQMDRSAAAIYSPDDDDDDETGASFGCTSNNAG
jgi:hypothetical protein